MTDKIKKVKVKQSTGEFGDYIPLGADAANVDLSNGQTVEESIAYLDSELLRADDTLGEVPATSFTLPTASATVLGGIKIGEGLAIDENGIVNTEMNFDKLAEVAKTGDYNDLIHTPDIPEAYQLPIATAANLGGVRIGTGLNIDAQTGVMSVINEGTMDYNNLENLPNLSIYVEKNNLANVATTGSYSDLNDKPTIPEVYNLPIASSTTLGGIKIGSGLSIDSAGILSAAASSSLMPITGSYTGDGTDNRLISGFNQTPTAVIIYGISGANISVPVAFLANGLAAVHGWDVSEQDTLIMGTTSAKHGTTNNGFYVHDEDGYNGSSMKYQYIVFFS